MNSSYNFRCPAVKRLLREAQELHEPTQEYYAQPLDDNLFEWHFTVRGPSETDFEGGVYHGRIILPSEYPMKPPNIIFLTANGRFETKKKICLSISGHHPETWQPSWSIRTALLAIVGFMPTSALGTLGSLDYTPAERKKLSVKSLEFECSNCGLVKKLLKERTSKDSAFMEEAKEISSQMVVVSKERDSSDGDEEGKSQLPSSEQLPSKDSQPPSEDSQPPSENGPLESSLSAQVSPVDPVLSRRTTTTSLITSTESSRFIGTSTTASLTTSTTASLTTSTIASSSWGHHSASPSQQSVGSTSSSGTSLANDVILSVAIFFLVALVLRRLFLMETETLDEMEDAFI